MGNAHAGNHWDYSQLLQIMRNFKDPSNPGLDLKTALLQGHPALWDEGAALSADQMPTGSVELPIPFSNVTVAITENGDIAINGVIQKKK